MKKTTKKRKIHKQKSGANNESSSFIINKISNNARGIIFENIIDMFKHYSNLIKDKMELLKDNNDWAAGIPGQQANEANIKYEFALEMINHIDNYNQTLDNFLNINLKIKLQYAAVEAAAAKKEAAEDAAQQAEQQAAAATEAEKAAAEAAATDAAQEAAEAAAEFKKQNDRKKFLSDVYKHTMFPQIPGYYYQLKNIMLRIKNFTPYDMLLINNSNHNGNDIANNINYNLNQILESINEIY